MANKVTAPPYPCPDLETDLSNAILDIGKLVILVPEGDRPFAIPDLYNRSAAVLNTYFGGQSAGQAVADVLFGDFNPGGRLSLSIPKTVASLPTYYSYKPSTARTYTDLGFGPAYPFGYGMSYTNFTTRGFRTDTIGERSFGANDTITFVVTVENTGSVAGSYVAQVYLLARVSTITQPVKQLVAFERMYLEAGERREAQMELDVQRYLRILNCKYKWEVEKGDSTFSLLESGGSLKTLEGTLH